VIAGKDSKDPGSAGKSFYYTPQYSRPMKELRVGYAPVDFTDRAEPSARPAFAEALRVLRDAGIEFVEPTWPQMPYGPVLSMILAAEEASIFEPLITSGQVDQLADQAQIAGLKAAMDVPARDYLKAQRIRRMIQDSILRLFGDVDILVAPGRPGPATKVTDRLDAGGPAGPVQGGFQGIIQAGNLAGLPALVLPCGFAENLPVALQLVGPPFSENALLAVGREFQSKTDWHKRRPPGVS
jgi:aspartyl-tRNA(Asn)/glutamyl-tRNA(Gln) amidotransferase subunit A